MQQKQQTVQRSKSRKKKMARKRVTGLINRAIRPQNCAALTNKSKDFEAQKDDYVRTIYNSRKKKGSEKSNCGREGSVPRGQGP
jgi:hypothetical protein